MLSKNIKRYRVKKGLSQEQLAQTAGATYSALSKIEAGYHTDPRVSTLQKIAKALEVTIDDLMCDEESGRGCV